MASANDYYAELGVAKGASEDELKKAYRALAMKLHPDRNQEDAAAEARFKKVNVAYEVLSDPKKRAVYDEFGEMGLRDGFDPAKAREYSRWQQQTGGGPNLEDLLGRDSGQPVDFSKIFDGFFGSAANVRGGGGFSGFRTAQPTRGRDLEGGLSITFGQSIRGSEVKLNVNNKEMTVRIPSGARSGTRLRVPGKGLPSSSGGPAGDLLLNIEVQPHERFWLEESGELHVRLPITLGEAFHGGKVRVPTADGDVTVTVPARSRSGTLLRVRGKGIAENKSRPATDLIVHLEIELPESTDPAIAAAVDIVEGGYVGNVRASVVL
ncbi:MAG: DnaJ C-terminal domain-containing protein [Deltaproteobacteria bacterium]|nr:DnaJ C-terminal domain-containing protein [Deltaproteobacteria bacterium]